MVYQTTVILTLLCTLGFSYAQFQFFDMFGQGQQRQTQNRGSSPSQWAAQADLGLHLNPASLFKHLFLIKAYALTVPCSQYLCPDTLICAANPIDCPCPNFEDEKCLIEDKKDRGSGTIVCVRGGTGCDQVDRLARPWS